ncbi:MFS general substrate transporter [Aspergillus sclerotioniger CBS 115572]|uniref:MFS general substrate transporter n=1 Tax=Aspergillus sclerotioniger CBS 115572 TaxID=1450535 RepID=A0A317W695_9EURO|nr:MFS general substrate transporter [Aspergillus sclerotioniger CBS 115572]PWY80757.1 MFS general substrate transporter [Aspergillus sclerotioniger CBS 115572]
MASVATPDGSSSPSHEQYPEDGLKAWSIVLGAWCAMIPAMGLLNSLGALQVWMTTHQLQEYSESSIGWIFGAYGFFLFFGGAMFGAILDSHGPLFVILPGSVGIILSLIFLSFSQEYYQIFLSFSVLGGIASSTLWSPPVAVVGHSFNERHGLATGVACTAGGVGGVIFPLLILVAAPRIGFTWSLRVIALLCAVLCSIACLRVKTRLPPKKADSFIDTGALGDIKYVSTSLAVFLVEFTIFTPITYIVSYALHVGISEKMSYAVPVFLNLGAVFGQFLPGLMADKWGRFNVMVFVCLMCAIFTLILWLCADLEAPSNLGMIISYAVLFGFWGGAAISLAPVCISQVCEIQDYGKRVGTTWTLVSFGTLIGIPIAGAIQQHDHGEYSGLIVPGGVMYAVTTVAFVVARGICGVSLLFTHDTPKNSTHETERPGRPQGFTGVQVTVF